MAIDRAVFTREYVLLLKHFGRESHEILTRRYFEYLDAHLTTEEFEAAALKVFHEERFWPAPITFLHAAKGDPKRLAGDAWAALLQAAQRGRPHDAPPQAIATLRRLGATFRDIELATEYRLSEIERAFRAEHATDDDTTPRLPNPALAEGG